MLLSSHFMFVIIFHKVITIFTQLVGISNQIFKYIIQFIKILCIFLASPASIDIAMQTYTLVIASVFSETIWNVLTHIYHLFHRLIIGFLDSIFKISDIESVLDISLANNVLVHTIWTLQINSVFV